MTDSVELKFTISDPLIVKAITKMLINQSNEIHSLENIRKSTDEVKQNGLVFAPIDDVDLSTMVRPVDSAGVEYDEEIHSRGRSKLNDGTWKKRRKLKTPPPPPPISQPEIESITYPDFYDQIKSNGLTDEIVQEAIMFLGLPALPILATREKDLYAVIQKATELQCSIQ